MQGYCYFDKTDGKFYVDTTNAAAGRMALNAYKADYATQLETARTITVGGKSLDFDGTQDLLFTLADIGAVPRVAAGATNQGIYIDSNGTI